MTDHVKFISYSGKYPNLCSGILKLEIDGKEYSFSYEKYFKPDEYDYDSFWTSGGRCFFNENYDDYDCTSEKWKIDKDELPEQFQKYVDEIDKVFNENVRWGCCGGCS